MATVFRHRRLAYRHKLFLLLLFCSWTLAGSFLFFQYEREVRFKVEQLNARLQLFNLKLLDALAEGTAADAFVARNRLPFDDLRVSVIDSAGTVLFDNSLDSLPPANHRSRPEIASALAHGTGYTIRRHSQMNGESYFYSAMFDGAIVVRSAVPYGSVGLSDLLAVDRAFIRFMLGVTLLLSVFAYFSTRRLSHNITRLSRFARKAERGERIYADEPFPDDELGDISSHIVRLYARMQGVIAERDRQHDFILQQEQEKIRLKKQLTNNINHELKTPVASLLACLETLLAHPGMAEERHRSFLRQCYANADRLRRLLDDVATITRMDDGTHQIAMEPFSLKLLIEELVEEMAPSAAESRLQIAVDVPGEAVMRGNPALVASIFRNLIGNAIAYSGGSRIDIRLLGETREHYRFLVSDDGTGVPERHLPHLFERFYRIDEGRSRKLGGTGLGLAIVKNAVLIHGGNISVRNRPGGGLEVEFTLHK